jgi:MFS family permease
MRLPGVWTTNLVALLFGAGMFGVYAFLPEFMQVPTVAGYGFGATVTRAGLLMLPMLVAMSVAGMLSGPLAPRFGPRAQLAWGSLLSTLAAASFAAYHDQPWQIGVAGAVFGLGMGMAYAAMASLIVQSVPARQTGVASGMNTNIRTIGGSLGTAIVSSIVTAAPQADGLPREAGFTHAFAVVAAVSAAAALVSLLVPSPRAARPASTPAPAKVPAEVG